MRDSVANPFSAEISPLFAVADEENVLDPARLDVDDAMQVAPLRARTAARRDAIAHRETLSLSPLSFSSPLPFPLSALVDSSTCPPHSFVHSLPFPSPHTSPPQNNISNNQQNLHTHAHTHTPHLMSITMHTPTPNGLSHHCPPPSRSYTSKQITNLSS
jgi:hypothetical protein